MDRAEHGKKKESEKHAARHQVLQRFLSWVPRVNDEHGKLVEQPPARGQFRDPGEMMAGRRKAKK